MLSTLSDIASVIQRTGDKFLFSDLKTGEDYVIMRLRDYQELVEQTSKKEAFALSPEPISSPLTGSKTFDIMEHDIPEESQRSEERDLPDASEFDEAMDRAPMKVMKDDRYGFEPLDE